MNCLSNDQLVALTLAEPADADVGAEQSHVAACAACAARLTQIQARLALLETATMMWFDRDHANERKRLLAALAEINSAPPKTRVVPKLLRLIAGPRTWIGSMAAAALILVLLLLWGASGRVSLVAQTVQALRGVRSYQCRLTINYPSPEGKKRQTATVKLYWAKPGSLRIDTYKDGKLIEVRILPKDKPGLEIDHRSETFSRLESQKGSLSSLLLMDKLAGYSGQADRRLQERQLNHVGAPGFEIGQPKIDPDAGNGTVRVWIDPQTKLPLRVEVIEPSRTTIWDRFQWDLPAEGWFTLEPPASYQDKTPAPADVERITKDIVTGLKTYAKYSGGKYPPVKMVFANVISEELKRNAGLPVRSPPKDARSSVYAECLRASAGFGWMNELQRQSSEAVYHGKTVGPKDKEKVLFRWKMNDGRFRVIFGDLGVKDVSKMRLKKLEEQ